MKELTKEKLEELMENVFSGLISSAVFIKSEFDRVYIIRIDSSKIKVIPLDKNITIKMQYINKKNYKKFLDNLFNLGYNFVEIINGVEIEEKKVDKK